MVDAESPTTVFGKGVQRLEILVWQVMLSTVSWLLMSATCLCTTIVLKHFRASGECFGNIVVILVFVYSEKSSL